MDSGSAHDEAKGGVRPPLKESTVLRNIDKMSTMSCDGSPA